MKDYNKMKVAELRNEYKCRIGSYPSSMKKVDFVRELQEADRAQSMSMDELREYLAAHRLL